MLVPQGEGFLERGVSRLVDADEDDVLVEGAGSESLSSMISSLHARISRWRALGLSHPKRSPTRSRESVEALRAMFAAIEAGDAVSAETLGREETNRAATEVMQLLTET